ncbi:MAG: FAD:protein FMN transferase [Gammaproteobacteria bacterium]|nr:MAG: FAD:protein FMN transferase [Gammaproteobacteria bacterium]
MAQLEKRMKPLMGCFVEIAIPQTSSTQAAFRAAFSRLELIQQLLSFHDAASNLSRLNASKGRQVVCHPLTLQCLRLAKAVTRASAGRFNCTLGAALTYRDLLPAHSYHEIYAEHLLVAGSWEDIQLTATSARLVRPMLITLDGIAKGFAIDSAILELKHMGIEEGWINAGGDIRVFGDVVLPVAVRDHHGKEHLLGGLQNASVATSTSIATKDFPGVLLDGSGKALAPLTSTVISTSAWRADALTKVAAATNADDRADTIAKLGGRWISL